MRFMEQATWLPGVYFNVAVKDKWNGNVKEGLAKLVEQLLKNPSKNEQMRKSSSLKVSAA